jgi:hypothetical protein
VQKEPIRQAGHQPLGRTRSAVGAVKTQSPTVTGSFLSHLSLQSSQKYDLF